MLAEALLIIAAVVALVLAWAAVQPRVATVSRSTLVRAAPAHVFALIYAPRSWQRWLPWTPDDPLVIITYAGPEQGPNAALSWKGNRRVGAGTITVVDGEPNDFIRIRIDFARPHPSTSFADFLFQANDEGTLVIWAMTSERSIALRLYAFLFKTDATVAGIFERGLARLRDAANQDAAAPIEKAK